MELLPTERKLRTGVLFQSGEVKPPVETGAMLELMLAMGPQGKQPRVEVYCRGPVVRCELQNEHAAALAVRIASYQMGRTAFLATA